ncbi:MAG: hypothetical protein RSC68_27070 [Acinetobacter sp.]
MSEYPKALYSGDKKHYEDAVAHDEAHEQELRELGFVNYIELPEYESCSSNSINSSEAQDLKQELLEALKTIESKDAEILDLKQTYIAETNQLRKENRLLELSGFGASELQKILDEKQVKYGSRDGKDELVKLVFDFEYPVEV